jgi:hypothetical protein
MTPTSAVKLENLIIGEVSGVDDPANESPGWMVTKAAGPSYPLGPDRAWDVGAAEARIRAETGAMDAPNSKYAMCFLSKSGDGNKFGDYKFLVCDVVDGGINVMPQAIHAAASRVSSSSLSATEKSVVQSKIDALTGTGEGATKGAEEVGILQKIKDLIFPTTPEGDIDMTSDELNAALDERLGPVISAVEELSKSVAEAAPVVEEPVLVADPVTPSESEVPALTIEAVAKAIEAGIEKALEPYNEILEKVMDRLEGTEKAVAFGTRKSVNGQETSTSPSGDAPQPTPDLADAITKALRNPSIGSVPLVPAQVAAGGEKE